MIKIDIDMPKNCDLCPFTDYYANCSLSEEYRSKFGKIETDYTNKPANCPLINADETKEIIWHPVTYRPMTVEERIKFAEYWGIEYCDTVSEVCFNCSMPDDGQEILITTKWGVEIDTCSYDPDEGYGLETRGDWDGVTAWSELPEPYKGSEEE